MYDIQADVNSWPETVLDNIKLYRNFWTKTMPAAFHSEGSINCDLDEYKFRKYSNIKQNDKNNIFCFGCDDAFGNGLKDEETWPYILSTKLKNDLVPKNYGVLGASLEYNTMCLYQLLNCISVENYPKALFFRISNPYRTFYIGSTEKQKPLIGHINLQVGEENTFENEFERSKNSEIGIKKMEYYSYNSAVFAFFRVIKYLKFIDQIAKNRNIPWFWCSTDPFFIKLPEKTFEKYYIGNYFIKNAESSKVETNEKIAIGFKELYEKHIF